MRSIGFVIWILFAANLAWAQDGLELNTDRPDQSNTPFLVPKGAFQIELGFLMEKDRTGDYVQTNIVYNNTLLKYGISNGLEIRLGGGYLGMEHSEDQYKMKRSFSPVVVGFKVRLFDEHGIVPQAALVSHVSINDGSALLTTSNITSDLILTFSNTLSDRWSLTYNAGVIVGESQITTFLYTVTLGHSITDRLSAYAESYGFFPYQVKADHRVDAGVMFKLFPLLQFDISGGVGLCNHSPDYFVGIGLSARFCKS